MVHELTRWANALGSEPAGQLLTELYANAVAQVIGVDRLRAR